LAAYHGADELCPEDISYSKRTGNGCFLPISRFPLPEIVYFLQKEKGYIESGRENGYNAAIIKYGVCPSEFAGMDDNRILHRAERVIL
jgi:hypothetical protein